MIRITSISLLLCLMEANAFLISPTELADRFSVTGTLFLSAVAFYYVTVEQVPKVSYSTRCDKWNTINFLLIFLAGVENSAASVVLKFGFADVATIERAELWFALFYIIMTLIVTLWFVWPVFEYEKERKLAKQRNAINQYPAELQRSFGSKLYGASGLRSTSMASEKHRRLRRDRLSTSLQREGHSSSSASSASSVCAGPFNEVDDAASSPASPVGRKRPAPSDPTAHPEATSSVGKDMRRRLRPRATPDTWGEKKVG